MDYWLSALGRFALAGACIAAAGATPAFATEARLVHCGTDTCLRLSGRRADPAVAIQVAERDLQVLGGRRWRIDVPLAAARLWQGVARDRLTITLADARTGSRRSETALLPPGALAGRIELAELVIGTN